MQDKHAKEPLCPGPLGGHAKGPVLAVLGIELHPERHWRQTAAGGWVRRQRDKQVSIRLAGTSDDEASDAGEKTSEEGVEREGPEGEAVRQLD